MTSRELLRFAANDQGSFGSEAAYTVDDGAGAGRISRSQFVDAGRTHFGSLVVALLRIRAFDGKPLSTTWQSDL